MIPGLGGCARTNYSPCITQVLVPGTCDCPLIRNIRSLCGCDRLGGLDVGSRSWRGWVDPVKSQCPYERETGEILGQKGRRLQGLE